MLYNRTQQYMGVACLTFDRQYIVATNKNQQPALQLSALLSASNTISAKNKNFISGGRSSQK